MKNTNNKYLIFGLIGLLVIGAVVVFTQYSGQMFQGDLIRSVTTYPVTTTSPTVSTSSYTVPDQTAATLARIESKVDALTAQLKIVKANTYWTGEIMSGYAVHIGQMFIYLDSKTKLTEILENIVALQTLLTTYLKN